MNYQRSHELFATALGLIPGGVNSPVRAFRAVGGEPFFAVRAQGARIWDVDGNEYIDYVGTWGPAIHGHAPAAIIEAIRETAGRGTSFGIPNPLAVEKVRLCNSGTEAVMSAIRLARGFTKRDKIIKFDGCYHGHVDSLLVRAGSGALTFGYPDSAGVPAAFVQHTVVVPYNDEEAVREALAANRGQVAGIILEPVAGNAGLYAPRPGFLEFLRRITAEEEVLLIFDEVMTGFRLACGGAQELYGIKPDLSCFGKVIGGGLPVGAFGGRREIMDHLAPLGPVYQAGTLSGNPLAMAAGLASLRLLSPQTYQRLDEAGAMLEKGMREIAARAKVPVTFNRVGSMFCGYFTQGPVWNLEDALRSDRARFAKFFHGLLQEGVYLAPSQFEAGFISTAHGSDEIEQTLRAVEKVMATL